MAAPAKINFKVYQGSTFYEVLRWESPIKIYMPITGITNTAPVVLTSATHGVPKGWRFRVTNVTGMKEIVSAADDYYQATVVTTNSITINAVNSLAYTAYVSGGIVEYNTPIDMAGMTARLQARTKIDSPDIIFSLTTENGGIVLDNINKTITLNITDAATAAMKFSTAVYSIELVSAGVVTPFAGGILTLVKEVTR